MPEAGGGEEDAVLLFVKIPNDEWAEHASLSNLLATSLSSSRTAVINNLNESLIGPLNTFQTGDNNDLQMEQRRASIMCLVDDSRARGDERFEAKDYDGAVAAWREGLIVQRQHLPANHPDIATTLHNMGMACHLRGSHCSAMVAWKTALRIRQTRLGVAHKHTKETENALWMLLDVLDGADESYCDQKRWLHQDQDRNMLQRKTSIAKEA
jgi:Tetratricopeptide repeat